MRTLLVFLLVTIASATALGQEQVSWSVTFVTPAGWAVNDNGPGGIFLSTAVEKNWIPDVPKSPHAWFIVMRNSKVCTEDRSLSSFQRSPDGRPLRGALACKQGFMVIGVYWDSDPEKDKHAMQMISMYDTLQLTK